MDLKKKIKGFFTLTRRANGGFTLIELIIVIAIVAILSGAGVVGYSTYVKRANESMDRQMIADIEQALILGAYTNNFAPGTVVGAVGLSKDADATGTEEAIVAILNAAYGESWPQQLRLKSDKYSGSNKSTILAAMQAAKEAGYDYFDSVPDSSYFATQGNTQAIVSDVDEIASALQGVLQGHGYAFSQFWGEDFHNSVNTGGLGETWNQTGNDQMAANLTVFAAANQINKITTSNTDADKTTMQNWINSWTGEPKAVTGGVNGYCADLVMQYGQCVAFYNYIKNKSTNTREIQTVKARYTALENAMIALKNPSDEGGYLGDFNSAITAFWSGVGTSRAKWQSSGQAKKDAEALLASMMAVNSLEKDYVSSSQSVLLNDKNAFKNAGAAEVLDAMVAYAGLEDLPDSACVIVLSIGADGSPVILSPLKESEK